MGVYLLYVVDKIKMQIANSGAVMYTNDVSCNCKLKKKKVRRRGKDMQIERTKNNHELFVCTSGNTNLVAATHIWHVRRFQAMSFVAGDCLSHFSCIPIHDALNCCAFLSAAVTSSLILS